VKFHLLNFQCVSYAVSRNSRRLSGSPLSLVKFHLPYVEFHLGKWNFTCPKWNSTSDKITLPARLDRPLQLHISQHMLLKPACYVEISTTRVRNG
jgi:hypothetical protein